MDYGLRYQSKQETPRKSIHIFSRYPVYGEKEIHRDRQHRITSCVVRYRNKKLN